MITSTPFHEYFNKPVLDLIPKSALKVLDIGCMNGILAREFKKTNPNSIWTGIEINSDYAQLARSYMDHVYVTNIENEDFDFFKKFSDVDCFVFADVLEHLYNPWNVIKQIRNVMKETAVVVACIPNAQHFSVIGRLLSGDFFYEDLGLMDRTHIRWFTKRTFLDLFEKNGFNVDQAVYIANGYPENVYLNLLKTAALSYSQKQVDDVDFNAFQFVFIASPKTY